MAKHSAYGWYLQVGLCTVNKVRQSMYRPCGFQEVEAPGFQRQLDFCLTVHYQLGKVIQMNQLDETMIY